MTLTLSIHGDGVHRSNCGGKANSLNELSDVDIADVPRGFVVTTEAYREHMREVHEEDLDDLLQQDNIHEKSSELRSMILEEDLSERLSQLILEEYDSNFSDDVMVAVRSSATTEDSEEDSFAGQQDTYLNVQRSNLVDKVKQCWASMFTERACVYREKKNISHDKAEMAVIVQEMVDADVSGVMFTNHPITGEDRLVVESAWGLGEGVVSGEVTPDRFVLNNENGDIIEEELPTKKQMFQWDGSDTSIRDVPSDKRESRTLDDSNLSHLSDIANQIRENHGEPQDIEWAISDGEIYVLQSRPITSIEEDTSASQSSEGSDSLIKGLGASPGVDSGSTYNADQSIEDISEGDILVAETTTPDMVPSMQKANAVVTDKGGLTSHAAIVSRELGVPAVVGTEDATEELENGDLVTVDGDKGLVESGDTGNQTEDDEQHSDSNNGYQPVTATDVKVNVSLPEMAERASNTGADAVGLLRIEHLVLSLGCTPKRYIADNSRESFIDELALGIKEVAEEFYPRNVRIRTLDAPTDEFRNLEGGESEPEEDNPMLGYRGIRKSLSANSTFDCQLKAYKKLIDMGYENVELMFPLINDEEDVDDIMDRMRSVGVEPNDHDWGVMIETPSSAIKIDSIVERPIDFVSFGTNDLTQYTMAVDRNNERVSDRFDETHEAVLTLIRDVIKSCRQAGVDTSICGEAASKEQMMDEVVECGITSVSVNIDSVDRVRRQIKKREQRIMLEDSLDNQ